MSALAEELAREAAPEHVKELAAEKMGEWKARAKELAAEKTVELKEQAKEKVMQTTMDVKERVDTSRGWGLLGAILGAGAGAILMKKAFTIREERFAGGTSGELSEIKDRAAQMKGRAVQMKGRAAHWFDEALESQPLMLALGSIALGVFASLMLPMTPRERQLMEPARRKAQEGISQLGDQLEQKLHGQEEEPEDRRIPQMPPMEDMSPKIH